MAERAGLPLAGLRVLDVGTRIGAPFCAGILGEQGAEVIKVEQPGTGDFMRSIGPFEDGYSLWWAVEGRGRKSVTCDLREVAGQELFRKLADRADVLVENFRPGTMDRWNIGPDAMHDRLVYVRISAFGQSGPYASRPGVDRVGIAFGGLLHLTGEPDRAPMRPGVTLSDYLTGVFAAEAAVAALYRRDATEDGQGDVVDAPLYGSILRILEWTVAAHAQHGTVRERYGNRLPNSAPMDNYATSDGRYVCIVAGSDANFARLCEAMGRHELLEDPELTTLSDRARNGDSINGLVADWCQALTADQVARRCLDAGVPFAVAADAADLASDPHIRERGDIIEIEDPVIGMTSQQAPYPRFTRTPRVKPTGAPLLGQHNNEVWRGLVGLSASEYDKALSAGVI